MNQSAPTLQHEAPISGWQAAIRVLTEPVKTFRRLGGEPPLWPPYFIQMLLGLVVFLLSLPVLMEGFEQGMAMAATQPGAEMPAGLAGTMKWVVLGMGALWSVAGPWVIGLILALVAAFFGQFQGGGVPFKAYLGMIGYARLPLALSGLLSGLYLAATKSALVLSPAVLLPEGTNRFAYALMSALNPFGLWYYALLAIGFAGLFGREPRKGWLFPAVLLLGGLLVTTLSSGLATGMNQPLP